MKASFYPSFAWSGIRKNSRLYVPYILTCTGMVTMYYIIAALAASPLISKLRGGDSIVTVLGLGSWVILIFAMIFLFYTNSFLIRRRTREFGLYNILGMDKRNIARILFWETLISSGVALIGGCTAGVFLFKLAELGLVNIMKGDVTYSLSVSWGSLVSSAGFFALIFLLIFLNTLRRVRAAKPVELLHSENAGEKPPKANWFLGILGAALLAVAYYLAVTIEEPLTALTWFFVAVILVILGSYLLFIAGSVVFCRLLQKKKSYYYKTNHFVSVSSMVYRMKRNGAGLASICILATMVLVMISSTASLYFGSEDALHARYPKDINFSAYMQNLSDMSDGNIAVLRAAIARAGENFDARPEQVADYRIAFFTGMVQDGVIETDLTKNSQVRTEANVNVYKANQFRSGPTICQIYMLSLDEYNRSMGTNETLDEGEALLYTVRAEYQNNTLAIQGGSAFQIKKQLSSFVGDGDSTASILPSMYVIVPDLNAALAGIADLTAANGDKIVTLEWRYAFDTPIDEENQMQLNAGIEEAVKTLSDTKRYGIGSFSCDSRALNRGDYYGTFGGLFFLGMILSVVFLFAAVLIIYYKQISEGYEDRSRFDIMQKVGMTKKEIRKSINSQLLTIFFLPLAGAGLHLGFAFPIIRRLLLLFALNNATLFAVTSLISFFVFALFYTFVYRMTSNAYYAIVSGAKKE